MTIVKKSEKDLPDVVPLRDKNMQGSKSYFDSEISHPQSPNANRKKLFDDRPWHSVEVFFGSLEVYAIYSSWNKFANLGWF